MFMLFLEYDRCNIFVVPPWTLHIPRPNFLQYHPLKWGVEMIFLRPKVKRRVLIGPSKLLVNLLVLDILYDLARYDCFLIYAQL